MITTGITIKDKASKVWQALTVKSQMKEWYFDIPDFELRVGATLNFYEPGDAREFHHRCTIREIIPEKKFSHTWTHPSHSKGESVVTWLLEEENGATHVTLQHEGIENFADGGAAFAPENYQMGWEGFMAILKNYVYGIRKHTYQVEINASAKKVWEVLFNDDTYRQWTNVFSAGSYYTGELKQGGRVHFLTPEGSGMYADVIVFTPYTNLMFQHIGEVAGFVEKPMDEATEKWTGAIENYILKEKGLVTTLLVEIDIAPESVEYFNDTFPRGLEKVRDLAEIK